MIASVSFEKTTYNVVPHKFEAGTPNIAGVIGLGAAIDYVTSLGARRHRRPRGRPAAPRDGGRSRPSRAPGWWGRRSTRLGVLSFVLEGIHPHDIGTVLDYEGIAVAHRTPLRAAGDGPLRPDRHHEGLPGLLQHAGRSWTPGPGDPQGAGDVHVSQGTPELRELYQEVILDHAKRPRNFREIRRPPERPTASTRCAGTRPPSSSSSKGTWSRT